MINTLYYTNITMITLKLLKPQTLTDFLLAKGMRYLCNLYSSTLSPKPDFAGLPLVKNIKIKIVQIL